MTPQTELEIHGNFFTHPFAELLTEIMQARLSGSLRVSEKEKKWVIYFKAGNIVFAVSNARNARLFDIMMRRNRLTKKDLAQIPNFSNDLEFAAFLEDRKFLTKAECDQLFAEQIEGIIIDILSSTKGDWSFSSLTRVREGLAFEINIKRLLMDYARCMPVDIVLGRFRSMEETFSHANVPLTDVQLNADEAFVLSRAAETPQTAAELVSLSAMPESRALHAIYTLWAGGLLNRNDWRPAFSESQIATMRGARLELKREAKVQQIIREPVAATPKPKPEPAKPAPKKTEVVISLEEYLQQVENAQTYYDILGVESTADIEELKRAYFRLARNFHPDKYHSEGGEKLHRIQNAFTELAQAHETLKNEATREMYDYRMRKELAEREKRRAAGSFGERDINQEQAAENFERGFSILMDGDAESSLPFLARAVHFAPKNARYHAYYGKALSTNEAQRHKAESEMQAALRIDPNNPTFRILLAEFFIQNNLLKRAEGELTRLLAIFPSNREARELLDKMRK